MSLLCSCSDGPCSASSLVCTLSYDRVAGEMFVYGLPPLVSVSSLAVCWSSLWPTSGRAGLKTCTFDASLIGFGIMHQRLSPRDIHSVGRFDERWRYHKMYVSRGEGARNSAFTDMDILSDPLTVICESRVAALQWLADPLFPEVPATFMKPCHWHSRFKGGWKDREHITALEGRTAVLTIRHIARSSGKVGQRHLILGDNLGVILALSKGRAASSCLLNCCRKVCAY